MSKSETITAYNSVKNYLSKNPLAVVALIIFILSMILLCVINAQLQWEKLDRMEEFGRNHRRASGH